MCTNDNDIISLQQFRYCMPPIKAWHIYTWKSLHKINGNGTIQVDKNEGITFSKALMIPHKRLSLWPILPRKFLDTTFITSKELAHSVNNVIELLCQVSFFHLSLTCVTYVKLHSFTTFPIAKPFVQYAQSVMTFPKKNSTFISSLHHPFRIPL